MRPRLVAISENLLVKFLHLIEEMGFSVGVYCVLSGPELTLAHISREGEVDVFLYFTLSLVEVLDIVEQILTLRKLVYRVQPNRTTAWNQLKRRHVETTYYDYAGQKQV